MAVYIGSKKVKELYFGGKKIKEAWYGGKKVFSSAHYSVEANKPFFGYTESDYWSSPTKVN